MARENGILADQFNTCILDEPIPLRVYKDLKKKDIPRFRPRSLRDYMRYKIKYSNISDTLDKTAYDKTNFEDEIRHWFTEAKRDDYIIDQIFREFDLANPDDTPDETGTWDEFFNQFAPMLNIPNPPPDADTESTDDSEVVITNQNPDFELPDHLKVETSSSAYGSSSNGNGSSSSETNIPGGLTSEEYEILVSEFGEEEVFRQFS